ncbi:MAG: ABC transporter permease [Treponema sp.]|jgi:ABC-type dipeptide/oligopeptide/nickel transport system permease component|nr:ABC transporter permease [Treponema sp.]
MYFALKRTGAALITLFLVSVFSFLAFSVIRGDPASLMLGTNATEEQLATFREELGLNRSIPVRYLEWLGNFLSGNLGNSLRFRSEAISVLIIERLPISFFLALLSLFFIVVIAVPVSLFSVRRENSLIDRIVNIGTATGISVPHFFLGVLFIWIFGISLRLFTAGVYVGYRSLCFPALAIAVPNAAILTKFLRSWLFKEQRSDYVRTARSKGASPSFALRRHALRNALIPSITVLGMIVAEVFSGSIVIEQVFAIPGIGRLLIAAITSRDYPLIQTLVVYIAFVVVIANTLVDIAIQVIDPRIRLEKEVRE